MNVYRNIIYCGLLTMFLVLPIIGKAQNVFQNEDSDTQNKGIVFKNERFYEFKVNTHGYAIAFGQGNLNTYYKTSYFLYEFGMLKDPTERRQNKNENVANEGISSGFVYGKQNSFYMLKFGLGRKRYFTEKARRKGIAVGLDYEGGITLGLLKPYHLKIKYPSLEVGQFEIRNEAYSEENHDKFIDYEDIYGGASFFDGIGQTSITVGAHAKISGHFALGAYDKYVRAINIGFMIDAYPTKVPILVERAEISNQRIFLNMFISFQFGKRT